MPRFKSRQRQWRCSAGAFIPVALLLLLLLNILNEHVSHDQQSLNCFCWGFVLPLSSLTVSSATTPSISWTTSVHGTPIRCATKAIASIPFVGMNTKTDSSRCTGRSSRSSTRRRNRLTMSINHQESSEDDDNEPRASTDLSSVSSKELGNAAAASATATATATNVSSPHLLLSTLLQPSSSCNVQQLGGTELAYIGDVVYELFVRSRTIWPPQRTADRQEIAVALVRAEHQSKLLAKLRDDASNTKSSSTGDDTNRFILTVQEEQVLKRGRNAASGRNHNRRNPAVYQDSTALEALVGYLYMSNPDRCGELLQWMSVHIDDV